MPSYTNSLSLPPSLPPSLSHTNIHMRAHTQAHTHTHTHTHMTHSCLWHVLFTCASWLIRTCAMTHSYVCHDSFVKCANHHECFIALYDMCAMTHCNVPWLTRVKVVHVQVCVPWLIHMCAMTHCDVTQPIHVLVLHLKVCVPWLIIMWYVCHDSCQCAMTHSCDSRVCSHVCAMTLSNVCHDSLRCDTSHSCDRRGCSCAIMHLYVCVTWLIAMWHDSLKWQSCMFTDEIDTYTLDKWISGTSLLFKNDYSKVCCSIL